VLVSVSRISCRNGRGPRGLDRVAVSVGGGRAVWCWVVRPWITAGSVYRGACGRAVWAGVSCAWRRQETGSGAGMRVTRWVGRFAATVAVTTCAGLVTASPVLARGCSVQLRVNVFGSSAPGSGWSLQGGLNAGKTATLRATARACPRGVDHIHGVWVSGQAGQSAWGDRSCTGTVCSWPVRSTTMSAADFQAYARTASGTKVRSNIVRVGWAGSGITGGWAWSFSTTPGGAVNRDGCVTFTARPHKMTWVGSGSSAGTWQRAGNEVTLDWPGKSRDTMLLAGDGQTMTGTNNLGDTVRAARGC